MQAQPKTHPKNPKRPPAINNTARSFHNKSDDPALESRLQEILDVLYSFYDVEIDMSLERVERFLHQLGDPHLKLPPVIHVAGTNGKGSVIAILQSLLEADDKSVHVATSPHLVHASERIQLAGDFISTENLIEVLEECLTVNRAEPITFFEMFMAATFLAMSRVSADYVLLETGMGGRLDATNVIPDPLCTIITTISKDHEKFLGNMLQDIAFEKAGIIKAGVPCVIGYQMPQALEAGVQKVFHDVSQSLSPEAKLYQYGTDWSIAPKTGDKKTVQFTWHNETIDVRRLNLEGFHQIYNQGAAMAAYRIITGQDFDAKKLSTDGPENPLLTIQWRGRLQKLETHPFNNMIPESSEIWIDGGHNDSAGEFLAQQAQEWAAQDGKELHLIIAMVTRKEPADFLKPLLPYVKSIISTKIIGEENSYTEQTLYEKIKEAGFENVKLAASPEEAVRNFAHQKDVRLLITGSLYFLGTILD